MKKKNPLAVQLGRLGGKARWEKTKSSKQRSEIMKRVRAAGKKL